MPLQMFVGAYAAFPPTWDRATEEALYAELRSWPELSGLEVPFYGTLHRHDPEWWLKQLRKDWKFILTGIPGVMDRLQLDPAFGLASTAALGRRAALEFCARAREAVIELNRAMGAKPVQAVALHSAPRPPHSSARAFQESLGEIRAWDWDGASLVIEHCDRAIEGQAPAKGFLSLQDELAAIRATAGTPCGLVINWGRSAIEGRRVDMPLAHIRIAGDLLAGLMFSGCCENDPLYGAWADSHAPFNRSLLTEERAAKALAAAGPSLGFSGFKIQALPREIGLDGRLALLRDSRAALNRARLASHALVRDSQS